MLSAILPYRPMPGGEQRLDAEYAAGEWDYLRGLDESPRFSVISGYCHYLKGGDSDILEVGCGEGILQERLDTSKYSGYLGVDVSAQAILRTLNKTNDKVKFVVADADNFAPDKSYDIIVFNECLEYFDNPLATVNRYEPFISKDGFIIISMFAGVDTVRTRRIWKMISSVYDTVTEVRLSNPSGFAWIIKVVRPQKTKFR